MLHCFDMETGGLERIEPQERPADGAAAMAGLARELELGLQLCEYEWSRYVWLNPAERGE